MNLNINFSIHLNLNLNFLNLIIQRNLRLHLAPVQIQSHNFRLNLLDLKTQSTNKQKASVHWLLELLQLQLPRLAFNLNNNFSLNCNLNFNLANLNFSLNCNLNFNRHAVSVAHQTFEPASGTSTSTINISSELM